MLKELGQQDYDTLFRRSLSTVKRLKTELDQQKRTREPIAVLGMGCRFPGGCHDPATFWRFLTEGSDGIVEVPEDRFRIEDFYDPDPSSAGKIYLKEAGFLQENVGEFDARFFGISPREAVEMDPQQRLLLEVSWEALERAGIPAQQLKGTQTGVFVGIISSEYALLSRANADMNPYTLTGSMSNIASGRISYILGVHGPSISLDTACSSSLVAVHLACESLHRGESSLALVGGVSLMLAPYGFRLLCGLHALAKDGRCKTFDADGDGYGRGEGCGVVVLKRLSDALRDKDPILAVIKGTGVNQDGPGSGLTVPNGKAQKELIQRTLEVANVTPADVSYLEIHGTGTALGDPIEFQALTEVFGKDDKREKPLYIGSVKSNIGHLEAAAGIASLIKAVLCLQNKQIPPNLHLHKINPKIHLERIPATVPQRVVPWEAARTHRTLGISAFGFSGTNAHAIVSELKDALDTTEYASFERPWHILALSAKDENALSQVVARYNEYLGNVSQERLEDICFTASVGRSHFAQRIAFIAEEMEDMKARVAEYHRGNRAAGIIEGPGQNPTPPKLTFLIHGKIKQGLAQSLFETQPVFQQTLRSCNEQLQKLADISLFETSQGDRIRNVVDNVNAPGLQDDILSFALHFSLMKLWEAWGVRPNAVMGSRSGEFVAACAAGIMNVETAFCFILEHWGVTRRGSGEKSLNHPQIRCISGYTGGPVEKQEAVASRYWERLLSGEPARKKGIEYLIQQGYQNFLQTGLMDDSSQGEDFFTSPGVHCFPSITEADPWRTLMHTLANLYYLGLDINWSGFEQGYNRRKVMLPTYPFQRKYYWCETTPASSVSQEKTERKNDETDRGSRERGLLPSCPDDNPLGGKTINAPIKPKPVEFCLSLDVVPDVKDTSGLLHVGYYLEMLSWAVKKLYHTRAFHVQTIDFLAALGIPESGSVTFSLTLNTERGSELDFSFFSHQRDDSWQKHAQGTILLDQTDAAGLSIETDLHADIISRCTDLYSGAEFYHQLQERGLFLGESVQWIEQVWSCEGEALAQLKLPRSLKAFSDYALGIHPGVFEACAQLFHAALPRSTDGDMKYMVTRWEDFVCEKPTFEQTWWCHVVLQDGPPTSGRLKGRFSLLDQSGTMVAQIHSGIMKGLNKEREDILRRVLEQPAKPKGQTSEARIVRDLQGLSQNQWRERLSDYLKQIFAQILGMDAQELRSDEALLNVGMDSLVGMEAKTKLEEELGIVLPIELLLGGPSILELTESMMALLSIKPSQIEHVKRDLPQPTYQMDVHSWIVHRKSNPHASVKLFCFPYGGGGASQYGDWQAKLPNHIEVCPVQLPGKENRIREKAFTDIDKATEVLKQILTAELDRPYAFYGHSAGALLAYRLAYKLWNELENKPGHLFAGAYSSPTILPNPLLALTREKFKAKGYDDIPDPESLSSMILEQRDEIATLLPVLSGISIELLRSLLPTTLAELQMVGSATLVDKLVFDVPITAIHGELDDKVSEPEMKAWRELTSGPFKSHTVSGDHYFLYEQQNQRQLLDLISQELQKYR